MPESTCWYVYSAKTQKATGGSKTDFATDRNILETTRLCINLLAYKLVARIR